MTMTRKLHPLLFSLCAGAVALAGCDTASGPPVIEPGASYEVHYQSDEGDPITLGFYNPDTAVFTSADVDWDFGGYWIEDGDVRLEVFTGVGAPIEDVTLEVGASYDANVWFDDQTTAESVTLGQVVVASIPAEGTGLEAAGKGSGTCNKSVRVKEGWWAPGVCKRVTATFCSGRLVSQRTEYVVTSRCG
jgi:hypothetical protein